MITLGDEMNSVHSASGSKSIPAEHQATVAREAFKVWWNNYRQKWDAPLDAKDIAFEAWMHQAGELCTTLKELQAARKELALHESLNPILSHAIRTTTHEP